MTTLRAMALLPVLLAAATLLVGCGRKEGDSKEEPHGKDDGHGHGQESPSSASFKAGKGVMVTEEKK